MEKSLNIKHFTIVVHWSNNEMCQVVQYCFWEIDTIYSQGYGIRHNYKARYTNTMPKALKWINLSMTLSCSCSNDIIASYVDLYNYCRFCSMYSVNIIVPVMWRALAVDWPHGTLLCTGKWEEGSAWLGHRGWDHIYAQVICATIKIHIYTDVCMQ